jgi:hypothetical protein
MQEEELIIRKLIDYLRKYGDHKDNCGITKVLRNPRAPTNSDGDRIYPRCNCGWTDIARSLNGGYLNTEG